MANNDGPVVADSAEQRKRAKYCEIERTHIFQPIAFATLGGMGTETLAFITALGKKVSEVTDEPRATMFLRQRLGIAIQKGSAACLLETLQVDAEDPLGADFRR